MRGGFNEPTLLSATCLLSKSHGNSEEQIRPPRNFLNWILIFCITPSGKYRLCYFGTFIAMYSEYYSWCLQNEWVSPGVFNDIRRRERVWLLKGDIFIDRGTIRMRELEKEIQLLTNNQSKQDEIASN